MSHPSFSDHLLLVMPRKSSYTTAVKLQVIEFADTHGKYGAAWHFGINKSNVRLWGRSQLDKMPKSKRANRACAAFFGRAGKLTYIMDS